MPKRLTENQKRAREIMAQQKWRSNRHELPDHYPEWQEAQSAEHTLRLEGFKRLEDQEIFDKIRTILIEEARYRKIFQRIADLFRTHDTMVCLTQSRESVVRGGVSNPGLEFRLLYHPNVKDIIKDAGSAIYTKSPSRWILPVEEKTHGRLQEFSQWIAVIIDIRTMAILVNVGVPDISAQPKDEDLFPVFPASRVVSKADIEAAILTQRPHDAIREKTLFIHDGSHFTQASEWDHIWTQCPLLLARYGVLTGEPRYVFYDVIQKNIVEMGFGNTSTETRAMIKRYADTIESHWATKDLHQEQAFTLTRSTLSQPA
ncbi:hypothetical protein VRRI112168_03380 [Vreelandella rituensis]|uniref:Uncharacterized protein n=1 Tax=Vreelandella rituensis TaxID=2282306 RepID=A0A368U9R4_9GAMM|nr:hypothetical protein [Halomonas rituensis]RCV93695.1 hypothetical protein DU506_00650 [Halomonas rituensis]